MRHSSKHIEKSNKKWQDKRVLVIGAGGFIGGHLADELLKKGAEVTAFVHYNAWNE